VSPHVLQVDPLAGQEGESLVDVLQAVDPHLALGGARLNKKWRIRGRCYDHYFRRFLPIFCEKMAFVSKTNVMIIFFSKTSSSLSKNANIFAKFFGENIFKIITSVPDVVLS
jgi:hypothetical protein